MKYVLRIGLTLLLISTGFAAEIGDIQKRWDTKFPSMAGAKIEAAPIKGLYMVTVPPRVFYVDEAVDYLVQGSILNVNRNLRNETRHARRNAVKLALKDVEKDMIVFAPKTKARHVVTVFTDVDCAYCRKLHSQIDKYNKLGIEIRYLAWPRTPPGTPSFKKSESVWCADDRKKAITLAKQDKKFASKPCANPVARHQKLGELLGVKGTPALVIETGELVSGYVPPDVLRRELDKLRTRMQSQAAGK